MFNEKKQTERFLNKIKINAFFAEITYLDRTHKIDEPPIIRNNEQKNLWVKYNGDIYSCQVLEKLKDP